MVSNLFLNCSGTEAESSQQQQTLTTTGLLDWIIDQVVTHYFPDTYQ